jgi:hypothetical protein
MAARPMVSASASESADHGFKSITGAIHISICFNTAFLLQSQYHCSKLLFVTNMHYCCVLLYVVIYLFSNYMYICIITQSYSGFPEMSPVLHFYSIHKRHLARSSLSSSIVMDSRMDWTSAMRPSMGTSAHSSTWGRVLRFSRRVSASCGAKRKGFYVFYGFTVLRVLTEFNIFTSFYGFLRFLQIFYVFTDFNGFTGFCGDQ